MKTRHYLVTVRSDERFTDQEMGDMIAGRCWNIQGVEPHGAESQFVARTADHVAVKVLVGLNHVPVE